SLAYSPGVAAASTAIANDPAAADELTVRSNLVGVISNGTAVLGLGSIGALASKPVMEGKAVLFKQFAGINVFDIEVDETNVDTFCTIVKALEPTFGGINLEDIKAPECFEIESRLREMMQIPVFHDDQHGTAIIVASAFINAMHLQEKQIGDVKIVCSGAGAAALACLDMLCAVGAKREHITVLDREGVVYEGRSHAMDRYKARYATTSTARSLDEAIKDADVFLGLSAPGVLKAETVATMAPSPLVMALANPEPEIRPEIVQKVRPDAICATGRSDYPNQVNNVLCFPFLFRGALDAGATAINEAMKLAAARAIAELARKESAAELGRAYGDKIYRFGPDYIIPKPFDPRLILEIAPAVAKAACESGIARRPIADFDEYRKSLIRYVYRSGTAMKPIVDRAQNAPRRVVYADGEDERILRAVQIVVDEGLAKPILIGRREVVGERIKRYGLRLQIDHDFELCDPQSDPRYREYWMLYHKLMGRKGVSREYARMVVRTRTVVIASLMLLRGEADAMLCGLVGQYHRTVEHVRNIIGCAKGMSNLYTMNMLVLDSGTVFIADTHVVFTPSVEELAEMTRLAAQKVRDFGLEPKVALLSHSNFGSSHHPDIERIRQAVQLIQNQCPDLAIEGEMHADTALDEQLRSQFLAEGRLDGAANLLIMPSLDAANIGYNLVKMLANGLSVGPIMLGAGMPLHVMTSAITTRGVVNMTVLAVDDANHYQYAGAGS
ncbi:MAG: NADP-dependent malic enzyme, partial [Pseudomonadota bacterium]